jgi:tight adherence protein C
VSGSALIGLLAAIVAAAVGRAALLASARRRRAATVAAAVPELVDRFRVAASAGHPVARCLELVAARAPPEVRPVVVAAVERCGRGASLADALAGLGSALGPLGATLADALAAAAATGAPLVPVLDRVAAAAHDHRRRTAEEAARRLPVTLLFPLVLCVLPAFVLLAVVPLLAASLGPLTP